jgi:hypothetical protein
MIGILQAAISGALLGFGVGAGLFEMWTVSISFFTASGVGLWLFIRSHLRRIC